MDKWRYMTVGEYEELERLAKKYGLPHPSQIQTVKIKEEKSETEREDR